MQASSLDKCMQVTSTGELQLTERSLIYFKPSQEPIRWPLECIRRYGYNHEDGTFILESGRRTETGEAIFGFLVDGGEDLVNRLNEKNDKRSSTNNLPNSDLQRVTHTIGANSQRVRMSPSSDESTRRHANVSTNESDRPMAATHLSQPEPRVNQSSNGLLDPLSYTSIDFSTTKALNESAQAHAAKRIK